jgi:hypothetical protein
MNRGTFLAALVVIYPPELLFPELHRRSIFRLRLSRELIALHYLKNLAA